MEEITKSFVKKYIEDNIDGTDGVDRDVLEYHLIKFFIKAYKHVNKGVKLPKDLEQDFESFLKMNKSFLLYNLA